MLRDPVAPRGRRLAVVVALAIVAGGLAAIAPWATGPAAEATAPFSFRAVADATADAARPHVALGGQRSLIADGSPRRVTYVRFSVAGLRQPVLRARLRVHVQDSTAGPSPSAGAVAPVASTTWSEARTTWANRPVVGARLGPFRGAARAGRWIEFDVTAAVRGNGPVSLAIVQSDPDGVFYDAREAGAAVAPRLVVATGARPAPTTTRPPTSSTDRLLLAAGDVAGCTWDGDELTARIIDRYPGVTVAGLGDMVQVRGTAAEFRDCYAPTWGRFRDRTRPAVGNHEYLTAGAGPYWDYFGSAAGARGKGWYSYDIGSSWHVVVLNANCWEAGASCKKGSEQERWLRADLAAHARPCTLAYWHQPLFSSIEGLDSVRPLWDALYDAGADLVLNGHKHGYERFAPQRPDGTRDPARGLREIVAATGGAPDFLPFGAPLPNSEVRASRVHGVLKLTLSTTGYRWDLLPAADTSFTDSGSGACH
ncbi:MAG: DNRLRE domain-containing protein [Acidimicrobiales bacterium]